MHTGCVAGRVLVRALDAAHVRRGVDDGVAVEIEARAPAAVEHVDLRRVADAEQRALEGHGVADAQRADLALVDRHSSV